MDPRELDALGEPDLDLFGLRIWVHGRQFPSAQDYWDGNWLRVTAILSTPASWVRTGGTILHLGEVHALKKGCEKLYETLTGQARLPCIEPNLAVEITAVTGGHLDVEIIVTPDQFVERHSFKTESDQTYLPAVIRSCETVLDKFPIREPEQLPQ